MSADPRAPAAAVAAAALAGILLAGCASGGTTVEEAARGQGAPEWVSGDGTVEQVPPARRGAGVDLDGTTLDGTGWSSGQERGKVLVLNVWGSWCPPCVAEMPALQAEWARLSAAGSPVAFMGVNTGESSATARAFVRKEKVTYPSLSSDGGTYALALQGKANATPTTLVLDRQGRIAARVSGQITGATLRGLVEDVLAEPA